VLTVVSSFLFVFSSHILSGRTFDVYHTFKHDVKVFSTNKDDDDDDDVALVRI